MPKKRLPKLFIGSAAERASLNVAYAVRDNLDYDADVQVWTEGIFKPSRYTLETLAAGLSEYDFAVFVFAPTDTAVIRGQTYNVVRDNVLFELGLFVGYLGRERCFLIRPRQLKALHFPTDLLGLTPLDYDAGRSNLEAALGRACNQIRNAISEQGKFRRKRVLLDKNVERRIAAIVSSETLKAVRIIKTKKTTVRPVGRKAFKRKPERLRKIRIQYT